MERSLAVIIPVYNEESCLPEVVEGWHAAIAGIAGARLVLIDDGSTDASLACAARLKERFQDLVVLAKSNSGHGPTCLYGYNWAVENGYEWVFQTDSDGQTDPAEFAAFWERRNSSPFIFGFRKSRQDGFDRTVISWVLKLVVLACLFTFVRDANVPFRLMRSAELGPLLKKIPPDLFLANVYLAALASREKWILWLPISFRPRIGGTPSVRFLKFAVVGLRTVSDFLRLK